jgi:hypothetical protein
MFCSEMSDPAPSNIDGPSSSVSLSYWGELAELGLDVARAVGGGGDRCYDADRLSDTSASSRILGSPTATT